ncbi:hypothetical protein Plhal304r1_c005g0021581 [Plasmopara halstedii]
MKRGVSKDFVKMFAGSSFDVPTYCQRKSSRIRADCCRSYLVGSEATQLLGSPAFVSCTQLLPMTMRTFTDA